MQSQGNRFERQPPAPPQTYDASFVREGGAPVAFAMSDEPERKPERKGRQIDAFLEELKTRQAGEPQLPTKVSYRKDLIADDALDVLKAQLEAGIDLEAVTLRQPIPNASKIICVGLNYRKPYPVDGSTTRK